MIDEALNQVRLAEQAADETVKAAKNKADALKKENAEKIKQLVASEAEKDAANRAELLKKAEEDGKVQLAKAAETALQEAKDMQKAAESKKPEAVKTVLAELF